MIPSYTAPFFGRHALMERYQRLIDHVSLNASVSFSVSCFILKSNLSARFRCLHLRPWCVHVSLGSSSPPRWSLHLLFRISLQFIIRHARASQASSCDQFHIIDVQRLEGLFFKMILFQSWHSFHNNNTSMRTY